MAKSKPQKRGAYKVSLERRKKRELPDQPTPIIHVPKVRRIKGPSSLDGKAIVERLSALEELMAYHQGGKETAEKYSRALNSLLACFCDLGLWKSYSTLSHLQKALEHLALGDVHKMFLPPKKQRGRQPDSLLLWELRFRIAALLAAISIDKDTQNDAAKRIYAELGAQVDQLKSDGRRGKKPKRPEQAIEKWLERLDVDPIRSVEDRKDPEPAALRLPKPRADDPFDKIKFFFRLDALRLQAEYLKLPPKKRQQWFKDEVNWLRDEVSESLNDRLSS